MVAFFEIAFVVLAVTLGIWWFRRTNLYRGHQRSGWRDPDQHGYGWGSNGMYTHTDPPERQSHQE